ncbi:MAG: SRPBCC family protein [Egibacteraceae bacterium]
MKLEHTFTVPVPVDEAFKVLLDIERIAPCMPGATLKEVSGEQFTGAVKVKVGPISMQYQGSGKFVDVDEEKHTATIDASGRETRGAGTAKATIRAMLSEIGERETEVHVETDLAITGKAAQFGRGVMDDVGAKLLGKFADCLSSELAGKPEPAPEPSPAAVTEATPAPEQATAPSQPTTQSQPTASAAATTSRARPTEEAIDLLGVAGAPIVKRLAPVIGVVLAIAALVFWLRRSSQD